MNEYWEIKRNVKQAETELDAAYEKKDRDAWEAAMRKRVSLGYKLRAAYATWKKSPNHYHESKAFPTYLHESRLPAACQVCGETDWAVGTLIGPSGQKKHPWYCRTCDHRLSLYEPKGDHVQPEKTFNEAGGSQCEHCGQHGTEWHHWFPTALFGDEADKGPFGLLCQPCHSRWHRITTPQISTVEGRRKAAAEGASDGMG